VLEDRARAPAPVVTVPCGSCGEPRPEDVPVCFACGQRELRASHDKRGKWSVVLRTTKDDVTSMEALHQVLGGLTGRNDLRLKFLIGNPNLYSRRERFEAIRLPARLFSQLDEEPARAIETALTARGLEAVARKRGLADLWRHRPARGAMVLSSVFACLTTVIAATAPEVTFLLPVGASLLGGSGLYWWWKLRGVRGLFQLRPAGLPAPGADRLLGSAREASGQLRDPEVRALFVEVSRELFRLARRAEALAQAHPQGSSEEALARRLLASAPSLTGRLEGIARRLETLDAALERDSDGDTMRALAVLDRRLGRERTPELEAARRELEQTLERRQTVEAERERLAATLCRALATVRDGYRRARSLKTLDEREATAVARALEELDAELGVPGGPDPA
jgi:hypothetical protein